MKDLEKDDIICCNSYRKLCDYEYDPQMSDDELISGLVHCEPIAIPGFFKRIENTGRRYILVSSCSDFGIALQRENPPWMDMRKWIEMMVGPDLGYKDLECQARFNKQKCNENDIHSVKCYAWTESTFSNIPNEVCHWFMTNLMFDLGETGRNHVTVIPFGIGSGGADAIMETRELNLYKDKTLYVNWQNFNVERAKLEHYYSNLSKQEGEEGITVCLSNDEKLPLEEYLKDVATHKFVMCPPGNGLDTYRVLESIYLGSAAIVAKNPTTTRCGNTRSLVAPKGLFGFTSKILNNIWGQAIEKEDEMDHEICKLSFWKKAFEQKCEEYGI